jgi:hypothetical protein
MDPSSRPFLIVIALVLGFVLLAGVAGILLARRYWAGNGDGKIEYRRLLQGLVGEEPFYYTYYPAMNKQPPSFRLFMPCATSLSFALRPEGAVERLFKRTGINREAQIGDRRFDDALYIVSDQEEETRRHLFAGQRRQAAERLLARGFTKVRVGDGRIEAVVFPFRADGPLPPERLQEAAEALLTLRQGLPPAPAAPTALQDLPPPLDNPFSGPWPAARIAAYALAVLPVVGGGIALMTGMHHYPLLSIGELLSAGLLAVAGAFVLFALLMAALLRGRAESHLDLILTVTIGLLGVPLGGYGGALFLNGHLDPGPATEHPVMVEEKYVSRNKDSLTYLVHLPSWRHPGSHERLPVDEKTYALLQPGEDWLTVVTKPGWLGYPWVLETRLGAPGRP